MNGCVTWLASTQSMLCTAREVLTSWWVILQMCLRITTACCSADVKARGRACEFANVSDGSLRVSDNRVLYIAAEAVQRAFIAMRAPSAVGRRFFRLRKFLRHGSTSHAVPVCDTCATRVRHVCAGLRRGAEYGDANDARQLRSDLKLNRCSAAVRTEQQPAVWRLLASS